MSAGNDMSRSILRMIKARGQTMTFRRVAEGVYDPATGQATPGVPQDENALVALVNYRLALVDGVNIQRGDRRALVSARKTDGSTLTKVPRTNDLLVGVGNTVQVITVEKIEVDGVPVAYTCQVRE